MLRQQLAVTATTKAAKAKRGAKVTAETDGKAEAPLTPADEVLYEALNAWRIDIAKQENVPAFVILHDSVLREIARSTPKDKIALAAISGNGESKLARFGEGILQVVAAK